MLRFEFLRNTLVTLAGLEGANRVDVSISIPDSDGLNLTGTVPVTVTVQPVANLRFIHVFVDNAKVAEGSSSPFVHQWDTTKVADGSHVLRAEAFYKTRKSQAQFAVTVANQGQQPPTAKPLVPTGLVAVAGDGEVVLSWNANDPAEQVDGYQVYITSPVDQTVSLDVDALSYTVTGLANGTTYDFRISAHNAVGYGDYTAVPVQATPQGAQQPTALGRGIGYLRLGDGILKSNAAKYDTLIITRNALPLQIAYDGRLLTYYSLIDVTTAPDPSHYGVNQQQARANGWILKDSGGREIVCPTFPDCVLGDIGNTAYLDAWIANVKRISSLFGASGFYSDNILNWGRLMGWSNNVVPAKYPNQQAWDDVMVNACRYVYERTRGSLYFAQNANAWLPNDDESNNGMRLARWWARTGQWADGLMIEYWMHLSPWGRSVRKVGTAWDANWDAYRGLHKLANGEPFPVTGGQVQLPRPVHFIALDEFTTAERAAQIYCFNTFLLDYQQAGSVFVAHISSGDEWHDEYDKLPLGARTDGGTPTKSGDVWTGRLQRGSASVNPVAGTAPPIQLTATGFAQPVSEPMVEVQASPAYLERMAKRRALLGPRRS